MINSNAPVKLAVSSCLLGNRVRYDGADNKFPLLIDELSQHFELIPFCPENHAMGTPRESIRITVDDEMKRHVITNFSKEEVGEPLLSSITHELSTIDSSVCGILLKAKSPSCGLQSVKYYHDNGQVEGKQNGLFAEALIDNYPRLPKEEDARLNDAWLKENFMMNIFALKDLKTFLSSDPTYHDLVQFHTSYKYLLQSRSEKEYRLMGRIVANHEKHELTHILTEYVQHFEIALTYKNSINKTINIIEHMIGFFKNQLSKEERAVLHDLTQEFKEQTIPLITLVETIKIYVNQYQIEFLQQQKFLDPYPRAFGLRSDVKSYRQAQGA
jgi:uncharacterized protein YbgA (DUF1722 family)/uncharacterized protein YbbK (DUF523 family)